MKVKEFWRKHKKKICVIGGTVVIGTAIAIITKDSKYMVNLKNKNAIVWGDNDSGFMDIEGVKELLDANKDNCSRFAIFREGPEPDQYVALIMSDGVI